MTVHLHPGVTVSIPHDCTDGFHGAFWRRPAAYLDPRIRSSISTYALMPPNQYAEGLDRLEQDIQSGLWEEAHSELLSANELDLGYRIITAELSP